MAETTNTNRVKFGLSNVHVGKIESYDDKTKKYTYGAMRPLPGAVTLDLDPEGEKSDFYADDILYFSQSANTGYSGTLEIAMIPAWFRREFLGEVVDENGVQLESSDGIVSEFAMTFEIKGDKTRTRYIFYRVNVARPGISGETVSGNITPKTDSMTLTAMPRANDHYTKGFIEPTDTNKAVYDAWHTQVTEPKTTTEAA